MELSKKQRWSIKRATARINIWEGAVRASKTIGSLIMFLIKIPLADKAGEIFLIGRTHDALKRNIIAVLQRLVGDDLHYFPGKREIHLWGRVIHVVSANDESSEVKIRGATISLAYGDEITTWPESFWRMLCSRLSLDSSSFLGTTNPDNPNHYLKKDWIDRSNVINLKSFHFKIDDNPFLSDTVKDEMKRMFTGLWYKRFILGQWCVAEGAVYDFFSEDENTLIRPPIADYYDVGIDYGTGNPTVFMLTGNSLKIKKPYIWAEREYYYDSQKKQRQKTDGEYSIDLMKFLSGVTSSIDSVIESKYGMEYLLNIKSKRKIDKPLHNIYIDPSAASFKLQLRRDGFTGIIDADNSVIDGIRTKASMLKNGDYSVCKCCKNYIDEYFGYIWDSKAQLKGEDKPIKIFDHCQDAMRYVLQTKFGKYTIDYSKFTK